MIQFFEVTNKDSSAIEFIALPAEWYGEKKCGSHRHARLSWKRMPSNRSHDLVHFPGELEALMKLSACGDTKALIEVDGKEIQEVWFIDTEAGIVKSYAVVPPLIDWSKPVKMGEYKGSTACATRRAGMAPYTPESFPGREVECPLDGPLSEVHRGHVQVLSVSGELLYGIPA